MKKSEVKKILLNCPLKVSVQEFSRTVLSTATGVGHLHIRLNQLKVTAQRVKEQPQEIYVEYTGYTVKDSIFNK